MKGTLSRKYTDIGLSRVFCRNSLTSHQSMNLLERLGRIIEMGSEWRRARCTSNVASATLA